MSAERVRAKGDLSRKRTIIQDDTTGTGEVRAPSDMPAADAAKDWQSAPPALR